TCSFTVTVLDQQPPMIECPANIIVNPQPGQSTAQVEFSPTASDNCPGVAVNCSPASGSTFPAGTTTVNCTAKDASGNEAKCSFTLTVNPSLPPTPLSNQDIAGGGNASFSTVASGSGPFTYVWKHDGHMLPGQSGSTLTLTNVGASAAGNY